jgi:DNA-binding response OmpR family regulator
MIDVMPTRELRPILVVGEDQLTPARLVAELRRLGQTAVWVDACESALEMIGAVKFGLVIVYVDRAAGWATCRRLAAASDCPAVVATRFLAADRRYRRRAFRDGIRGYMCPPFNRRRLRELLTRVRAGERAVELVVGAPYVQC